MPLACAISGANRPDGEFLIPLIDAIPKIKGKVGAPAFRPDAVVADKAYTWLRNHVALGIRGIEAWLPEKGTDDDQHLGVFRWVGGVVERTIAWLHQFRRLRVRYERRADIHEAFLTLGCILICHGCLQEAFWKGLLVARTPSCREHVKSMAKSASISYGPSTPIMAIKPQASR